MPDFIYVYSDKSKCRNILTISCSTKHSTKETVSLNPGTNKIDITDISVINITGNQYTIEFNAAETEAIGFPVAIGSITIGGHVCDPYHFFAIIELAPAR